MIKHETVPSAYRVLTIIGPCFNGVGSVWLARHATSGNLVAVKKYEVDRCNHEILAILEHEIRVMRLLRHPNLMPCLSSFVCGSELWMVEPLCGYGSAKDLLAAHFSEGLPERAIALMLRDVLRALDYLHRQGYIHRSIRASHILVGESGGAYLTGLRASLALYSHGRRLRQAHCYPDCAQDSLNWLSPEILAQDLRGYDESSDVYSLGITACELANGLEPFAHMPPTMMLYQKLDGDGEPVLLDSTTVDPTSIIDHHRPPSPPAPAAHGTDVPPTTLQDNSPVYAAGSPVVEVPRVMQVAHRRRFSDQFHQFVRLCVQRQPVHRPSAAQLLRHPFIVKQCKRAPPLSQLLRPGVPVNESNLLEGEQIKSDSLVTDVANLQVNANAWEF